MASPKLLTGRIWTEITSKIRRHPTNAAAAIAFLGKGAARMLPMGTGSRLVVDASEAVVRSGLTHPRDLAALVRRGVQVHSEPGLHAKVVVAGSTAFVGSANASKNSRHFLQEAVLRTDDRSVSRACRVFVGSLGGPALGPKELRRLQSIYRPPQGPNREVKVSRTATGGLASWRIVKLERGLPPAETRSVEKAALAAARQKLKREGKARSHAIDDFWWGGPFPVAAGQPILMVTESPNGAHWVSPPGIVILTRTARTGGRQITFVELEVPRGQSEQSLKRAKRRLSRLAWRRLTGPAGRLGNREVQAEILALWA